MKKIFAISIISILLTGCVGMTETEKFKEVLEENSYECSENICTRVIEGNIENMGFFEDLQYTEINLNELSYTSYFNFTDQGVRSQYKYYYNTDTAEGYTMFLNKEKEYPVEAKYTFTYDYKTTNGTCLKTINYIESKECNVLEPHGYEIRNIKNELINLAKNNNIDLDKVSKGE